MGIQELQIKGFRSLRDVRWTPGRLNVLIGPNGSGKSNLLRALELLQASTRERLSDEILRQGGIDQILWDGQESSVRWDVDLDTGLGSQMDYQLELKKFGKGNSYRVEYESLRLEEYSVLERNPENTFLDGQEPSFTSEFSSIRTAISYISVPSLGPLAYDLRNAIQQWHIYHDLRTDPSAPIRQAAVAKFDLHVEPDGQNLIPYLHTLYSSNRDFKKTIDSCMRAAFGSDYEELVFPPAADQRVLLRLRWRPLTREQSNADLPDGLLRFLILIAILANPDPGTLIAIDEPETGLHPEMLPIVAGLALDAAERTQVLFTTHSPQFLDAFGEEAPTTTIAEWEEGETRLSVVDGEELQRWLKEYSLGSLFTSGTLEAIA